MTTKLPCGAQEWTTEKHYAFCVESHKANAEMLAEGKAAGPRGHWARKDYATWIRRNRRWMAQSAELVGGVAWVNPFGVPCTNYTS